MNGARARWTQAGATIEAPQLAVRSRRASADQIGVSCLALPSQLRLTLSKAPSALSLD